MLCQNPFIKDGAAYGCGQCMPCRKNKHRIWASRIMVESLQWSDNTMVTLTYDEDHMPRLDDGRGILVRDELTGFLKRLRKAVQPHKFRFFGCGEYGDESMRPHFHVILFNMPNCVYGQSRYDKRLRIVECCKNCDLIRDKWARGGVFLCELNMSTSQYVAQYVTKKMLHVDDPRLKGLSPEFPAMSLRPGIGYDAMYDYASTLLEFDIHHRRVDVPSTIQIGKRVLPLGRYLQKRLRVLVGKDAKAPKEVTDQIASELLGVRQAAFEASKSFKSAIVEENKQAVRNMEVRSGIHKQRKDKL